MAKQYKQWQDEACKEDIPSEFPLDVLTSPCSGYLDILICLLGGVDISFEKSYGSEASSFSHIANAPESDYQCYLCHKTYTTAKSLNRHRKVHLKGTVSILDISVDIPAIGSSALPQVISREFSHSGDGAHECDICNKSYSRKDRLKNHMKVHLTEPHLTSEISADITKIDAKFHECDICHKSYSRKDTLKIHMKVHLRETPLTYDISADITRISSSGLLKKTHLDVKTHECDICHKSYSRKDTLKKHMKIHLK